MTDEKSMERRVRKTAIPTLLIMVMEGLDGNDQPLAAAAARELTNRAYRPKDKEFGDKRAKMIATLRRAMAIARTIGERRHTQPNIDELNDTLGTLVPAIMADVKHTIQLIEELP